MLMGLRFVPQAFHMSTTHGSHSTIRIQSAPRFPTRRARNREREPQNRARSTSPARAGSSKKRYVHWRHQHKAPPRKRQPAQAKAFSDHEMSSLISSLRSSPLFGTEPRVCIVSDNDLWELATKAAEFPSQQPHLTDGTVMEPVTVLNNNSIIDRMFNTSCPLFYLLLTGKLLHMDSDLFF